MNPSGRHRETETAPPPLTMPCTACWIELELLDEEDQPVPNEPYWIRLADGSIREGRLNAAGMVRLDGIHCGVCLVRFPKYDTRDVAWRKSFEGQKKDWIEIRLVDELDRPVPNEEYEVQCPDGSLQSGKLDKQGRARVEGIAPGTCVVRFPGIDKTEFVESRQ